MTLCLPTEVLEAVVDSVALGDGEVRLQTLTSLCLTGKPLVTRARMHIYRSITLHPASDDAHSTQNDVYSQMYRKSHLLSRTLVRRPHLAEHVKSLRCLITTPLAPDDVQIGEITAAMSKMLNIKSFVYGFMNLSEATHDGAVYLSHTLLQSHTWLSAIAKVLKATTLRRLRLQNFRFFPPELLQMARSVTRFDLHLTTISGPKHFWDKISSHILEEYDPGCVSNARELGVTWLSSREPPSRHLLSHCSLAKTLRARLISQPSERQSRMEWPVYSLHIDNLQSLTHLDVQIDTYLRGPDTILYYVFGPWKWDDVLPKLARLEKLTVLLNFQGDLQVHTDTFGSQWGDIASALSDHPDAAAELKDLALRVDVRVRDKGQGGQSQRANRFLEQVRRAVGTHHLLIMHEVGQKRGTISHSFHAEISLGPFVALT